MKHMVCLNVRHCSARRVSFARKRTAVSLNEPKRPHGTVLLPGLQPQRIWRDGKVCARMCVCVCVRARMCVHMCVYVYERDCEREIEWLRSRG
jgi:hypothetical protein